MNKSNYIKVYELLLKIPKWKVSTYWEMWNKLWLHPRTIWIILWKNQHPNKYPCYKIICSDWKIWGFAFGIEEKINRLKFDWIEIINWKIWKKYFYHFNK